jgi:large subunit ribosomal protein L25
MKLEATVRATDTASASALRQQGRLPAIVYNRGMNVSVSVDERSFDRVFRSQGTSNLIDLEVDGEVHEVLVKAVQMNKRARVAVHVDFYAVTAGQKVSLHVPIELVGTPVGVKDGGQLDVQRREVHISILPRLIPHSLQLDVTELTIGDSLHVSDLRSLLPDEAEILDDLELAVVAVVPPRLAVEDEPSDEADEVEPEVIGEEGEREDGDAASED